VSAAPGSSLWLLRHEIRLAWYGSAFSGGKRRPGTVSMVVWVLAMVIMHVLAFAVLAGLRKSGIGDALLGVAAGAVLAVCATFMLSTALKTCVTALFERGDLDLLLSSPLPSRSIFAVRLLGVAASTAALFLFLFAPFAHVAVLMGRPGMLAIYPAILALAALIACAAMLLTLALVRVLGARRTRTLAQVLAAVAGALLFLLSQAANFMPRGERGAMTEHTAQALLQHGLLAPGSPLWLPGRAALGDAVPLLGMIALALAAFVLTVGRTHRFFVRGLQQAAAIGRVAPAPAGGLRFRFRSNLFETMVIKEWRLIKRDPHLISQVLLQLIYLVPMLALVVRGNGAPGPLLGTGLTMLCSSLAGSLAWIVISAEDAPDLLRASPAAERAIRLAKLAAAVMPPLLLVALPLLWLLVRAPLPGLMAAFTVSASVLSAGLIVLWAGRPAQRSNFKGRGKENMLSTFLEMFSTLSWAALSWALISMTARATSWTLLAGAAALAVAFAVLLTAWLLRRNRG